MKLIITFFALILTSLMAQAQEGQGCFFNNHVVMDGSSVMAYQNSAVPYGSVCVSETRTCSNGVLSGSFNFGSCSIDAPASCLFNGQTIPNGQSVIAYPASTVPYGQACVSQVELCTNGILSGNDPYASCSVAAPASCVFNGQTVPSGQTILAYQSSSVPYGQSCVPQTELCTNGTFDGNYAFANCTVAAPASCLFNGQTIAHGQTVVTYPSGSVPYGQTCTPVVETCDNGVLSGNNPFASCTVGSPAPCEFDGQSIPDSHSVTAYQDPSVPYGQQCLSQMRTCANGVLTGNFAFNSCSVQPASPDDFVPSTKAEKLAFLSFLSCGIHNRSFKKSFSPVQPSLEQILSRVKACTATAYPDTTLAPAAAATIAKLIDAKDASMRNKFFSGLWYQPPYTDHFETYFGIYSPDILGVLCYDRSAEEALEGNDITSEYAQACLGQGFSGPCREWHHNRAAQARWRAIQKERAQLRKCLQ